MHTEPDDPDVAERMRTAHSHARTALDLLPDQDAHEAWGWRGRTLSRPVIAPDGPAWLRIACAPTGQIIPTFWDGSLEAEKSIPRSVPRPRLRDSHVHWANISAPTLLILDWEGWGLAPSSYDDAVLHSYSQLVPRLAVRLRSELAHLTRYPHRPIRRTGRHHPTPPQHHPRRQPRTGRTTPQPRRPAAGTPGAPQPLTPGAPLGWPSPVTPGSPPGWLSLTAAAQGVGGT